MNDDANDTQDSARNLPVVQTRSLAEPRTGASRHCRPFRSQAPFLAQLSLQYDDIEVVRQARKDRLETAARRYGQPTAAAACSQDGTRQDIHI